jgi:hypothetical protein
VEQQNPPGKPHAVLEWALTKQYPGELGRFQKSAIRGQIAFSCFQNLLELFFGKKAQVLIYYWARLKRHLRKSTKRQICNYIVSPRRSVLLTDWVEFRWATWEELTQAGVLTFWDTCWGILLQQFTAKRVLQRPESNKCHSDPQAIVRFSPLCGGEGQS